MHLISHDARITRRADRPPFSRDVRRCADRENLRAFGHRHAVRGSETTQSKFPTNSPLARVRMATNTAGLICSFRNLTEPSPNPAFAPAG